MFDELSRMHERPPPFGEGDPTELWTDPHIAEQMVEVHLDPDVDAASPPHELIDRSVDWLVQTFDLRAGRRVLDLGCGPGLYALPLAMTGASVHGVDVNPVSLDHAVAQASRVEAPVQYSLANYLEVDPGGPFDLVLLLMRDLCVLPRERRARLLASIRSWLRPDGAFVVDVASEAAFHEREPAATYAWSPGHGFWSPSPHFVFTTTFLYPDELLVLDRYTLVEPTRTRRFSDWTQHFSPTSLAEEFDAAGLRIDQLLADPAGTPHEPDGPSFTVVARA